MAVIGADIEQTSAQAGAERVKAAAVARSSSTEVQALVQGECGSISGVIIRGESKRDAECIEVSACGTLGQQRAIQPKLSQARRRPASRTFHRRRGVLSIRRSTSHPKLAMSIWINDDAKPHPSFRKTRKVTRP